MKNHLRKSLIVPTRISFVPRGKLAPKINRTETIIWEDRVAYFVFQERTKHHLHESSIGISKFENLVVWWDFEIANFRNFGLKANLRYFILFILSSYCFLGKN